MYDGFSIHKSSYLRLDEGGTFSFLNKHKVHSVCDLSTLFHCTCQFPSYLKCSGNLLVASCSLSDTKTYSQMKAQVRKLNEKIHSRKREMSIIIDDNSR